jgi:hypothetical protein
MRVVAIIVLVKKKKTGCAKQHISQPCKNVDSRCWVLKRATSLHSGTYYTLVLRVLMVVYYTWDYWVPGHCPLCNILKEHKVLETGSVSILRWKGGYDLSPLSRANLNYWTRSNAFPHSIEDGKRSSFQNIVCSFRIGWCTKSRNSVILTH